VFDWINCNIYYYYGTPNSHSLSVIVVLILEQQLVSEPGTYLYKST
jgi:hypothetical protein